MNTKKVVEKGIDNYLSLDTNWLFIHTKILQRFLISAKEKEYYIEKSTETNKQLRSFALSVAKAIGEDIIGGNEKKPREIEASGYFKYEVRNILRHEQRKVLDKIISELKGKK